MHCSEMRFHATFISLLHITPHITIVEKTLNFCLQIILLTIHLKFVITKNSPSFSYYATKTWLIIYEHIFFGWAAYHKEHVTVHLIPEQAKTWPLWQVSLHLNSFITTVLFRLAEAKVVMNCTLSRYVWGMQLPDFTFCIFMQTIFGMDSFNWQL